ncbi:hypothetical protein ACQEVF_05125 [Nonomuraea polychroma]|uniref:hypothetical protein n=1 Tax=Nonomuraea polychroma TaxID=46176 RepID=UPI003D93CC49
MKGIRYKWIDREIARLDPETQHHEIVRLIALFRLNEFLLNIGYVVNFMDVTMPRHGGDALIFGGKVVHRPQQRFEDSAYFLWTWYLCPPDSEPVKRSMELLNRIHGAAAKGLPGAFSHNEDYVQGLCLLAVLPHRLQQLCGLPGYPEHLRVAYFNWARALSEHVAIEGGAPVKDFPADFYEMVDFADEYDSRQWPRTRNGHTASEAFVQQFCERWFPRPFRGVGRTLMLTVIPENMRRVQQLEDPHPLGEVLVKLGMRAMFTLQRLLPDPLVPIHRRKPGRLDSPTLRRLKESGGRLPDRPPRRRASTSRQNQHFEVADA